MQETPLSCTAILVGIALILVLFFFGLASATETVRTKRIDEEQTLNAISATSAQRERFLQQTYQARASMFTPTPTN